jgi:hypothetical protein
MTPKKVAVLAFEGCPPVELALERARAAITRRMSPRS